MKEMRSLLFIAAVVLYACRSYGCKEVGVDLTQKVRNAVIVEVKKTPRWRDYIVDEAGVDYLDPRTATAVLKKGSKKLRLKYQVKSPGDCNVYLKLLSETPMT